jgi:hypothetical protein
VLVGADRLEHEHLRLDFFLQVEHQPHHARAVLADPHLLDVRVARLDLGDQALERRVQVEPFDVDHQPFRVLHDEVGRFQVAVVFQRDAGVVGRRPDPHREDLRGHRRQRRQHRQQQGAARLEDSAPRKRTWSGWCEGETVRHQPNSDNGAILHTTFAGRRNVQVRRRHQRARQAIRRCRCYRN